MSTTKLKQKKTEATETRGHSEAPWSLQDAGPNSGNVVRAEIMGANGEHIADLIDPIFAGDEPENAMPEKEWLKNARLINAAPDLLAAATEVYYALEGTNCAALRSILCVAIVKATEGDEE